MIAIREMSMRGLTVIGLWSCLVAAAWTQDREPPESRTVLGAPVNIELAEGSRALSAGNYDEGIELTLIGLQDESLTDRDRAAGLSNLCAAYAAKQMPDTAVRYCTESLTLDDRNWRAYSNRSYAYWIMGRYSEAQLDLDVATSLNPQARQVAAIRGMINEATLQPNVRMEDLQ